MSMLGETRTVFARRIIFEAAAGRNGTHMSRAKSLVVLVIGFMLVTAGAAHAERLISGGHNDSPADTIQRLHDELKSAYDSRDADAFAKKVADIDSAVADLNRSGLEVMRHDEIRANLDEAQRLNDELSTEIEAVPPEQRHARLLAGLVQALGQLLSSLLATLTQLVNNLLAVVPVPGGP